MPEDGLVDLSDTSADSTSAMYNTQRHRNRLMQRLQHIRYSVVFITVGIRLHNAVKCFWKCGLSLWNNNI